MDSNIFNTNNRTPIVNTDYLKPLTIGQASDVGISDVEKYTRMGLTPNHIDDLDKQLYEVQSTFDKWKNSIAQTIISEVTLGTVKGVSDLFDMIGQVTGISDPNYSNPVSQYLEQKQEEFREWAPIYTDPDKNILNGGLLDAGWWASNMPSVASSLTLLIPSTLTVKGLSLVGRALNAGAYTRKAIRTLSGAEKSLKEYRLAKKTGNATDAINELKKLNKFQRFINSSSTANATSLFLENGTTAALSRAMENYQEARQTYNDMYVNASERLKQMSDEDYNNFVNRNKELIENENVDISNKDAVAKAIAKASADRTFKMDWINVGFDIIQIYGLRNAWKGLKNSPVSSSKIRRENIDAAKYFGKTKEQIAELKKARSFKEKAGEWIEDKAYGSKFIIGAQLSEGIEEAINYVAQQEGMNLGKVLLGQEQKSTFDTRLSKYVQTPELYDAAFWGVMGGVVFQGLGSQFRRLSNKLTEDKRATDKAKQKLPWYKLDELPEIKRLKTEIEARGLDFEQYKQHLANIKKGIDIYKSTKDNEVKFESDQERIAAEKKLKHEYISKMTLRAMNSGNLDMLKAYLSDDNVRKGMVESGIFNEEDKTKTKQQLEQESKEYINDALDVMEKVEQMYDEELIAVDSASSVINSRPRKGNKDFFTNNNIPAEYMQIIAVNNVMNRLQIENIDTELAAVNSRIAELTTQFENKLDPNINYEQNIRLGVLTNKLGQLRAQRKALAEEKEKSLSNQIAISNIDKQINSIEKDLNDEELVYSTFISLQYKLDEKGIPVQSTNDEDLAKAYIYRDNLIVQGLGKGKGIVKNIEGLEYLSTRSRTSIDDATIGRYQTLEADARTTFGTLREISPELDTLYQIKASIEKSKDFIQEDISRTVSQVEEQVGMLHNTMNEARKQAIDKANKTIQDLYEKYGDVVRNGIYSLYYSDDIGDFESNTKELTKEERQSLSDAIDVLALSKSYNQSLINHIEEQFAIQDLIKSAKEVSTDNETIVEESENSSTLNLSDTDNISTQSIDSSVSTQEGFNGSENRQIDNSPKVIDRQNIENRNPTSYAKWYIKRNKLESGRPNSTDDGGSAIYDNEDGTFTIDVRDDAKMLNSQLMFSNADSIDLTRPVKIEQYPIAKKLPNGKFEIIEKGRLVNTDTLEYQQEQEQKEDINKEQVETTTEEIVPPTTISSTGEVVETDKGIVKETTPSPKAVTQQVSDTTPVEETALTSISTKSTSSNKYEEDVINQVPSDDAIKNETLAKIIPIIRNNHDADLNALAIQIINDYVVKGIDRTIAEKAVNWAVGVGQRTLDKLKKNNSNVTMRSSIDEVLITQSSITELVSDSPEVKAYKDAVRAMINQYIKEVGIRKINDKIYINFEDLLRYTNTSTNDSETANMLYSSMKNWLMSSEAQKEFITTDKEEINKANFLKNVAKSSRVRYIERLSDISTQRVDIKSIVKAWTELGDTKSVNEFYDALDELQSGDKLYTEKFKGLIHIKDSKGRTVGTLPIPKINKFTGAYEVYNDGWKTDILASNNNKIHSEFKNLLIKWLTYKDAACQELNDIIFQLAYDNLDQTERGNLLTKLEENAEWINAKKLGFMRDDATRNQLAEGLVKLWRFTKSNNFYDKQDYIDLINDSLDSWFDKLKFSYDAVKALEQNAGDIDISVATISDGELIRIVENDKIKAQQEALPVKEAIAGGVNPNIHKIAVADKINRGWLDVSGMTAQPFSGVNDANTFVLIPNRSGRHGYVHAYPAEVIDDYIGEDAKEIMKVIHDKIVELLNAHNNNPSEETFNDVEKFFIALLDSKNENRSLFNGLTVSTTITRTGNKVLNIGIPKTANQIKIFSDSNSVFIGKDDFPEREITTSNEQKIKTKTHGFKLDAQNTYKHIFEILNNLSFKLNYSYISSDNVSDQPMKGFATKRNGKFEISIAGKNWTYNSFNEFILNNNLVRLNTKPSEDGKSNYNRRGERSQLANQVFEIKINKVGISNTTSPVEERTEQEPITPVKTNLSISEKAQAILDSTNDKQHKGLEIAKLVFNENTLKTFEKLDILPKNIIFDPEFNNRKGYKTINAEVNKSTGIVTVGTKWKVLFDNPNTQSEAIRKLIHEQLHNQLTKKRGYIRSAKEIYNEFKEALEAGIDNEWYREFIKNSGKTKQEVDIYFRQYLFENENEEIALEEFLVESLTSSDLAEMLNSIDAKDYDAKKGSKNLFQKILELLSNVFGWNVRKGSLYEKELNTLRKNFKEVKKEESQTNDNIKKEPENETQKAITPNVKNTSVVIPEPSQQTPAKFGNDISDDILDMFESSITEIKPSVMDNYSDEMNNIKQQAISNGTFMKAPNGKPTNLTERQWLHVRTKAFKEWFGDWENDAKNASKVVDENSEPLVVYHRTKEIDIPIFDRKKVQHYGFWFSVDKDYYTKNKSNRSNFNTIAAFLNVRTPNIISHRDFGNAIDGGEEQNLDNTKYDGWITKDFFEAESPYDWDYAMEMQEQGIDIDKKVFIMATNPNQIKSAESNIGTFSTTDNNIRHSSITEIAKNVPSITSFKERLPLSQQGKFASLVASAEISSSCG